MKKIFFCFICTYLLPIQMLKAQDTTLGKLKLNFVVPDMPAFNVLGTEPSNILRPSTPKELAVSFSEFYDDRKFVLPKAFALEISPALLINSKKGPQQLSQYIKNQVINSLRVSIGTSSDSVLSPSGRSSAVGLRISLINKGDFAMDLMQQIAGRLREFRKDISGGFMAEFASRNGIDTTQEDWEVALTQEPLKSKFNQEIADSTNEIQTGFLKDIKAIKEKYKKDHWNDEKLDVAVAVLGSSPDSLVKNMRFNRVSLWVTYAAKTGKSSQLLVGLLAQTARDLTDSSKATMDKSYSSISVPIRYLIGTNRVRGFSEVQYSYLEQGDAHKVLVNLGSEVNIVDGFWFTLYGGMDYNSKIGQASFVASLNLKVTLPENFKLF